MNDLKALIKQFMPFAQEKMGFDRPPKLFLKQDAENAANPLGKTGFYDPESEAITLYTTNRHPKDIMRSLSHELMHHTQKCNGEFDNTEGMGEQGYAQKDSHLRTMEIEAYQASIVFRDWEDSIKGTIYNEHLQKGVKSSMSTKDWKNGEINTLLTEKWGFSFSLDKLNEAGYEKDPADFTGTKKREDEEEEALKTGGALEEDGQIDEKSKKDSPDRVGGRDVARRVRPLEETDEELEEGDTGASKGDKGKDKEDPKDRDYSGHGMRKGDESDTHKGEKDDTTKKGEKLKHSGKGRGEKKGDKAYVNENSNLTEDSGEEEGEHYDRNEMSDEDHIRAIEHHLDALRRDRDYDDDHIDENRKLQEAKARKLARSLVQRLKEMKKNG